MALAWGRLLLSAALLFSLGACSTFRPFAVDLSKENKGLVIVNFKHVHQKERFDCGEGALSLVLGYWGAPKSPRAILADIFQGRSAVGGTTAKDLADYAKSLGFHAFLIQTSSNDIREQLRKGRPLIVCRKVFGGLNHYEVVVGFNDATGEVIVANPANGVVSCSWKSFEKIHAQTDRFTLLILPK